MTKYWLKTVAPFAAALLLCCWYTSAPYVYGQEPGAAGPGIKLPPPSLDGTLSVEKKHCRKGDLSGFTNPKPFLWLKSPRFSGPPKG